MEIGRHDTYFLWKLGDMIPISFNFAASVAGLIASRWSRRMVSALASAARSGGKLGDMIPISFNFAASAAGLIASRWSRRLVSALASAARSACGVSAPDQAGTPQCRLGDRYAQTASDREWHRHTHSCSSGRSGNRSNAGFTVTNSSSTPARCARTLDHGQSSARSTKPARTGFRLT